ncbi:hypothetical protein [Pseudarthrobacter sp. H2]|uniref:hypothetical protein n=1 Tax=Pseudarthrobacter sp. H2 TaxID=3418415 RepID=UPI003CF610A5
MKRFLGLCLAAMLALAFLDAAALISGPATAGAPACHTGIAAPAASNTGKATEAATIESGAMAGFKVFTSGTGTALVSSASSPATTCAAFLHTTTDSGSVAKMTFALAGPTAEVSAAGWFNITAEGTAGSNVPYFRFFAGGARILDVFRQNVSHELVLRVASPKGFLYTTLLPEVTQGTWHHLVMRVLPDGSKTGVQIWWDGRSIYTSNKVSINASTVDMVQLGSEHDQQTGDIYVDDVTISGSAAPGPIPGTFPAPAPDSSKVPGAVSPPGS